MIVDSKWIQTQVKQLSKQILLPRFNAVSRHYKADGSIVTEADLLMQKELRTSLKAAYPDIALLGEEMSQEEQTALLASGQPLWCLDPVDGTSNFAAGLPFFCVSLALIVDHQLVFGVVYDPIRDECFSAYHDHGAYLNDEKISPFSSSLKLSKAMAFIDFKRLPQSLSQKLLTEKPFGSHRYLGSTALELCWLAIGRGHLYLRGQQQLWDYAGAAVILSELGLSNETFEGEAVFNGCLPARSAISACHSSLFTQWANYIRGQ